MCLGQTHFFSTKIVNTQKESARKNFLSSKQQPQNYQQNEIYKFPYSKLQQFSTNNSFLSVKLQTNRLARMQALYKNKVKWAFINNFYNQRRQQLTYAAYMMAQNNITQNRLLLNKQNVNSCFTPQQSLSNNMIHVNNQRYNSYCQPKLNNIGSNKIKSNTTAKVKSKVLNKRLHQEKLNSSTEVRHQKHKHPPSTINNALDNAATTNIKKSIENIKAMIADSSNKKNKSCLDDNTRNNQKQFQSYSKSSDVISINLPNSYKSSNYQTLSPGNSFQTNNQIIVSEKQAELIVNQVKEQMRGRDPENMYIKCPLCEKRIKR